MRKRRTKKKEEKNVEVEEGGGEDLRRVLATRKELVLPRPATILAAELFW